MMRGATRRKWLILSVMVPLTVSALYILAIFMIGQDVQQGSFIDNFNSTGGTWHECAFEFSDNSGRIILMRRRLPGLVGWHAEFGLQMRIELPDGAMVAIPLGYTENKRTEFYSTTGVLEDDTRVPMLRIESYGSTYRIDMMNLETLSFEEVTDETDTTFLGHFDGINIFIPDDPSVIAVVDHCNTASTTE